MNRMTSDMKPAPESLARNASEGVDRLAKSAHSGIDAASEAARPVIDRAASGAHRVVDNAEEMVAHAAEVLERAGVKSEELIEVGTSYVRAHPLVTLGVAVAAGYVLGRVLDSR